MSEVRVGATIGETEEGDWIVTARIPVRRVEAVQQHPAVVSLQASQPVRPVLGATIEETGAAQGFLSQEASPEGGRGVVIGIVDFGCDFVHGNFRTEGGATRIEAIWDQASADPTNSAFGYGRVHRRADIDAALLAPNPYAALRYGPERDTPAQKGTHGTHVMDIAAGNGFGSGVAGCAPEATIVFVDLSATDIAWVGPEAVDVSFGDSVRLLEAVRFVFDQAGDRPCVVNLSLGTNGGPHDGTTAVERGLDALVRAKPNRAVVIAASNSYVDGIHASVTVPAFDEVDLRWEHPNEDQAAELDVWFPGFSRIAVELFAEDGSSLGIVEPDDNRELVFGNSIAIFVANQLDAEGNHDNHIGIYLAGVFPAGSWTVRLHSRSNVDVAGHAWIERNDFGQSSFAPPHDNTHTLGSISCGKHSIVVGSYDAHKASVPISYFSSSGPTRDGRQKPEVSAPGHAVLAAWSRTGTAVTRKSGTSMAAPAVSGIIALMLAEARRQNRDLSIDEIREYVFDSTRKHPPFSAAPWDPRYGYGRLHAPTLLSSLIPALEDVG